MTSTQHYLIIMLLLLFVNFTSTAQSKYQKDFLEMWTDIHENYAYLKEQNIDWQKVREIYEPQAAKISNDAQFILFLENVLNELHNGHSSLNVNLASSNRLVPSGLMLRVQKQNDKYMITHIRKGYGAEQSGLKTGMEVIAVNNKAIEPQLLQFLPKHTDNHTPQMLQYATDMLFAGKYNAPIDITVIVNAAPQTFRPQFAEITNPLLSVKILDKKSAYIKINNSLDESELVPAFDDALDSLLNYKNLFIDLTDTPGGGNTMVARALMGRFVNKKLGYQIHEFDETAFNTKRHWVEYVTPRGKQFKGKVYLLVGPFTGSMGEGIAIGMDAMNAATVIGTKMAGLLGAISNFTLSETQFGFQIPTERLYHVNGTAREDFIPSKPTKTIEKLLKKFDSEAP